MSSKRAKRTQKDTYHNETVITEEGNRFTSAAVTLSKSPLLAKILC